MSALEESGLPQLEEIKVHDYTEGTDRQEPNRLCTRQAKLRLPFRYIYFGYLSISSCHFKNEYCINQPSIAVTECLKQSLWRFGKEWPPQTWVFECLAHRHLVLLDKCLGWG